MALIFGLGFPEKSPHPTQQWLAVQANNLLVSHQESSTYGREVTVCLTGHSVASLKTIAGRRTQNGPCNN